MIDFLTDTRQDTSLLFLNSEIRNGYLIADFGYISMGLTTIKWQLMNELNDILLLVALPPQALRLPKDVATSLKNDPIEIIHIYE